MRRIALLFVCVVAFGSTGCKEKSELRALCALPMVGERAFETPTVALVATSLRKAEESEEIATGLEKKRKETDDKRIAQLAANKAQRADAEAIPLDDRDARRKAILEVTALEQETQKLSDEIAKYHVDIERNEQTAAASRKAAAAALAPLQREHGVTACPVLAGPAKAAAKP